ncbi:MAG: hypothetical protein Tsb0014_41400 [Pleurocapsa sp.]
MLAPWRSHLSRALHRNRSQPNSRYLQLATVSPQGIPANRTVVFRGFFSDENNSLKIVTDSRSDKINHIHHQPQVEACWYFPKTREQFRLAGTIQVITAAESDRELQQARQTTWQNLSDAARSQFAWAEPGKPLVNPEASNIDISIPDSPLSNFCLLLLIPHRVDRLELKGNPHNRCLYCLQSDGTWSIQPVNP